jgi:dTMP kinase
MKNKFIVIEGLDGSGKSEVSKKVSGAIGYYHLESPVPPFRDIRVEVDNNLCSKGRFYFYLASNYDLSRFVKTEKENRSIICARYFYSTIIGYFSRSGHRINDLYDNQFIGKDDFIKPDAVIFLHVSKEAQYRRIKARDASLNSIGDMKCLEDDAYQTRLSLNYLDVAITEGWIKIDTSDLSEDEVVEQCLQVIFKI